MRERLGALWRACIPGTDFSDWGPPGSHTSEKLMSFCQAHTHTGRQVNSSRSHCTGLCRMRHTEMLVKVVGTSNRIPRFAERGPVCGL
eukprot:1193125-Prorocentrum_minimum.AAC.4